MMKKSVRSKISILLIMVVMAAALLVSCANEEGGSSYLIAYTNSTNDDIEYYSYAMNDEGKSANEIVEELITQLFTESRADGVHYSPLPSDVGLNSISLEDGIVSLDFNEGYNDLSNVQKIILRVSVVLTLAQVDDVEGINFSVDNEPITDSEGNAIGTMNPDQYVNILLSDEELLKQETTLRIYFSDISKTSLLPVLYSFTLDNQSQSLEEYIVRKIIEGPDTDQVLPTVDPNVELISVMTTEKTCYVNFGPDFLTQNIDVSDELMVYSIVDSLTELAYINNVQILVEGRSDIVLHKFLDLSKPLTKRYDLISDGSVVIPDIPENK